MHMEAVVSVQLHIVSLIFSAGWGLPGHPINFGNLALPAKEACVVVNAHWMVNVRVPIHNHGGACSGAIKVVVYVFISKRLHMIAKSYYNASVSLSSLRFPSLGWFTGTFTLVDGYAPLKIAN